MIREIGILERKPEWSGKSGYRKERRKTVKRAWKRVIKNALRGSKGDAQGDDLFFLCTQVWIRMIPFFMRAPDQFSADQLSTDQFSADQLSTDQFSADQFSADQFSPHQLSATFVAM